jgi:hypothetical protein
MKKPEVYQDSSELAARVGTLLKLKNWVFRNDFIDIQRLLPRIKFWLFP